MSHARVTGRFDADAWVAPQRTPRFYPDAVTLDPGAVGEGILERIDTIAPGCSVKDSFAALDLSPFGFEVVHEAEWIHRAPRPAPSAIDSAIRWTPLQKDADLVAWEAAWDVARLDLGLFKPALLRDPSVTILGGYVAGAIVAGAIGIEPERSWACPDLFASTG